MKFKETNSKDKDTKTRKNWIQIPDEKDIFLNLICKKCVKILRTSSSFYISNENPKIYCIECGKILIKQGKSLILKKIEDINKKFILNLLEKKKCSKYIFGRNLYINFAILIREYRTNVSFCNY
ncbi:MAG: hypothetical protein ACTSWY_11175 [Promethearchaeota archaeon]